MSDNKLMSIKYICDGTPERIPAIGSMIDMPPEVVNGATNWKFRVDAYGETRELDPSELGGLVYHGKVRPYEIVLLGTLVLPAGSPINSLDKLLGL